MAFLFMEAVFRTGCARSSVEGAAVRQEVPQGLGRRGRRYAVIVTMSVIGCSLLASSGASASTSHEGAARASSPTMETAHRCRTEAAFQTRGTWPKMQVKSAGPGLSTYRDKFGRTLIGPKGWHCGSVVGADGNSLMAISPHVGRNLFSSLANVSGQAVTATAIPACAGCQYEEICAVFPTASLVKQTESVYGPCGPRPSLETLETVGRFDVRFEDPPGTGGTGSPSGGAFPALGEMRWSRLGGVTKVTCTLAAASRDSCDKIIRRGMLK